MSEEGDAGSDGAGNGDADGDRYDCDNCGARFDRSAATRTATMADLDSHAWQTLCCPNCGARVKTVFLGGDRGGRS